MMSRMVRPAMSAQRLVRLTPSALNQLRTLSSAASSASAVGTKDEKNTAVKPIFEEYSVFPVVGFIAAWAISTETLIVNDEFLLVCLQVFGFATVLQGIKGPFHAKAMEWREGLVNKIEDAREGSKVTLKESLEKQQKFLNLADIVERVTHYRADLAQQALEAKVRRSKVNRNKSVHERLVRVIAFEQDLKAKRSGLNKEIQEEVLFSAVTKKITPDMQSKINGWLIEHLTSGAQAPLDNVNSFIQSEVSSARAAAAKGIPKEVETKFADKIADLERQEQFFKNLINRID